MSSPDHEDAYARLQYRRVVAWPERIRREEPFLLEVLRSSPHPSLIDLGCGTGEHAIHFARAGFRVVGVDRSEAQLQEAANQAGDADVRFLRGDISRLAEVVDERFGTAICLGNTLVHVVDEAELDATCLGVHAALQPGGAWVFQILNYVRIRSAGVRYLPLNFRAGDDGTELVFLRLLRPLEAGRIEFMPTTLRVHPGSDAPVEVVATRSIVHRAWLVDELEKALRASGFMSIQWFGDMSGGAFDPEGSTDLVGVVRRER